MRVNERRANKLKKIHFPSFLRYSPSKSKLTYKVGNPLKRVLSYKRPRIRMGKY